MKKNSIRGRFLSRWTLAVLWWGLCAILLVGNLRFTPSDDSATGVVDEPLIAPPAKNEMKGFHFTRYDQEHKHRPVMQAAFDKLSVENGTAGVFRTALHKAVTIENLKAQFYTYSAGSSPRSSLIKEMTQWLKPELTRTGQRQSVLDVQSGLASNVEFASALPDVSNTTQITIKDFEYQRFFDQQLHLTVRSLRAKVTVKDTESILLRGHVVLSDERGTTLQSNTVRWDISKQQFTVNGTYNLNRNGERTQGRGLCLDEQLNPVTPAVAQKTNWRK